MPREAVVNEPKHANTELSLVMFTPPKLVISQQVPHAQPASISRKSRESRSCLGPVRKARVHEGGWEAFALVCPVPKPAIGAETQS